MTVDQDQALELFYRDVDAVDLAPLWTITDQLLPRTPRPKAVPWLWPASTYRPLAERAIQLVPVERGGERRVLSLRNPGLAGRPYAAGTLWGAVQCLGPRETAPAHRHTPGAIRFVLDGDGVFTTVDGDACDMHPGDLVLTPAWTWHDHSNAADSTMLWFDGLDLPMVEALDAVFFEPHPANNQPVIGPHNRSEAAYGDRADKFADGHVSRVSAATRHLQAAGFEPPSDAEDHPSRRLDPSPASQPLDPSPSPLLVYRWADTAAELDRLAMARPGDPAVDVEYVNPRSGASVLPTLACGMLRVIGGRSTPPSRRSGNRVFVVHRGTGHSVIDGQRFDWGPGDMFVVPSWSAAEHHGEQTADVFTLDDSPVLRALGIYREEIMTAPQPVTSTFVPRGTR